MCRRRIRTLSELQALLRERGVTVGNRDAIDYEGGGGICRNNVFERNRDDAIDLDNATEVIVEGNVIRNNVISGNTEDGIKIIDYHRRRG